jgi:hypothetical protein
MSFKSVPITEIPHFLTSEDEIELQRLMLSNNILWGVVFKYDITFAKGKWYAWYRHDIVETNKKNSEKKGAK